MVILVTYEVSDAELIGKDLGSPVEGKCKNETILVEYNPKP